ncbi:hypothetical protein [Chloroflexus sp.]|uniref:hypothetical protein n=1 Tax=Chloroflexus sp. TaxID=1904827 RepID=UPI00258F6228|nr:hypothetical protein [Chloroflexus sp.]
MRVAHQLPRGLVPQAATEDGRWPPKNTFRRRETAPELGCEMVALEMMPDQLHLVVSATPQIEAQRTRG